MDAKKTCFVAMGFGKKTDYQSGRLLDLDESYRCIIHPAVEQAGLTCVRADEIQHAGVIDVPMYEQLLSADVVLADISTTNANAFYELGTRHALRPYTTITIAEDKMIFPFDVSHLAIRKYQHLGEKIDPREAERMVGELVSALQAILADPQKDSPIYTFLSDLEPPVRKKIERAVAQSAPSASGLTAPLVNQAEATQITVRQVMNLAEAARKASDFVQAIAFLSTARAFAPSDPFIIQRLALATYKAELPDAVTALRSAEAILKELRPTVSNDPETVGLWGAIHKRLWERAGDRADLDTALLSYEKGFYLKDDYYNGINLAYLYNVRAAISTGSDAIADVVMARRIRKRVSGLCQDWLSQDDLRLTEYSKAAAAGDAQPAPDPLAEERYWVLATLAEACAGLGDDPAAEAWLAQAKALPAAAGYMLQSTENQLKSLRALLASVPLV